MKTALICDDEPILRMSLKNTLREAGFAEIIECGDGEAAVASALGRFPDVIILDVAMPKMDGISAARAIRKRLKVPILLLTACLDQQTITKAKEAGVAGFLTKPFRQQDLWPAIELAVAHTLQIDDLMVQVEDLKEALEDRKVIEKAKGALMRSRGLTEPDAFRQMQKLAMDKRTSLRQIAAAILLTEA